MTINGERVVIRTIKRCPLCAKSVEAAILNPKPNDEAERVCKLGQYEHVRLNGRDFLLIWSANV
ncbi:MAG: hypothetical protein M9941_19785 [Anaerolineae bacterium]|nr:hypothetical protein [Anaerolineae bacterium]